MGPGQLPPGLMPMITRYEIRVPLKVEKEIVELASENWADVWAELTKHGTAHVRVVRRVIDAQNGSVAQTDIVNPTQEGPDGN